MFIRLVCSLLKQVENIWVFPKAFWDEENILNKILLHPPISKTVFLIGG